MAKLDFDLVRHALTVARSNGFAEVDLRVGDDNFSAKLYGKARPRPAHTPTEEPVAEHNGLIDVKAQLVGYYRPAKTALEVGAEVSQGDAIAIIAALGISNDVEAPASGTVEEVLVEVNQPLEFGQVIARIKP